MATSETYKDKTTGERKEITEWHNIVLWRGLADVAAKYLHKGDMVYIEGRLRTRSWEKEGVTRYTTEIVGDNMTMLSTKPTSGNQEYASPGAAAPRRTIPELHPCATSLQRKARRMTCLSNLICGKSCFIG